MRLLWELALLGLFAGVAVGQIPNAPTLTTPASAAADQLVSPTLRWNASTGATNYRVQIALDSTFASLLVNDSTVTATSRIVGPLSNSTRYYWRVSAKSINGSSPFSSVRWFTTIIAVPGQAFLFAPPTSSTNQPALITLQWDPVPTATSYRLQISRDTPFQAGQIVHDDSVIIGTSKQVGPLGNDTTFYWRVRAKNAGGSGLYSDIWNFTTIVAPPAMPVLLSPPSGGLNQPTSVLLRWRTGQRSERYHLQVALDSPFDSIIVSDSTITDTTKTIPGLNNFTAYYWRVRGINIGGTSAFSPVWNFTTALPTPTPVAPASGSLNLPTSSILSWTPVPNADFYKLQVATDTLFSVPFFSDSTISTTSRLVPGMQTNRVYYWRVRAKNGGTISVYSQPWSFTTVPAAPATPSLVSPVSNAVGVPTSAVLRWRAAATASLYDLQVAYDAGFTSILLRDSTLTDTTLVVPGLQNLTSYYWRVRAKNAGGSSTFSPGWRYTTIIATPALLTPSNLSVNHPLTLGLTWSVSTGATHYRVQVATDSLFQTLVLNDSTLTSPSRTVGPLLNGREYFWRVSAKYSGGSTSFSSFWRFTTLPNPPTAPHLVSPPSLSTNTPTAIAFVWEAVPLAATYRLQVATDPSFTTIVFNDSTIVDTTRTVNLQNNITHYWRVQAKNGAGTSPLSSVWNLTTIIAAPSQPTLVLPALGAVNQPTNLTVRWRVAPRAERYHVQIAYDTPFDSVAFGDSTVTDTLAQVAGLQHFRRYYWRVRSMNIGGTSPFSTIRDFVTTVDEPVLVSPADSSVNHPLASTFAWGTVNGATLYHFQLSTDAAFSQLVVNDSLLSQTTRLVSGLVNNRSHFWRVRARNANGVGSYSQVRTFTTVIAPPVTPVLVSPTSGSVGNPGTPTLRWRLVPTAATYKVQVAHDAGFASLVLNDSTVTDTTRIVAGLSPLTTYYWRVRATNAGGMSPYSPAWTFKTIGPPLTVVLFAPANNSTNTSTDVSFRWRTPGDQTSLLAPSGYWMEIVTDTISQAGVFQDSTLTDTTRTVSGLANGTTHFWRVRARNAMGWNQASPYWRFTTIVGTPALASPASGSVNQPTTLTLGWSIVTTATSYRLQVSTDSLFVSTFLNDSTIVTPTRQVGGLQNFRRYFWRVRAKNSFGWGQYSIINVFTTIVLPPTTPVLLSPASGLTGNPPTPTVRWRSSAWASGYRLQVASDTGFTVLALDDSSLTDTARTLTGLLPLTTYYWRVRAMNVAGVSHYTSHWNFRTVGFPAGVILHTPLNNSVNAPVDTIFKWKKAIEQTSPTSSIHPRDGAFTIGRYWFELMTDTVSRAGLVIDTSLTDTSKGVSGLLNTTAYYWRVRAKNEYGWGNFSTFWRITTIIAAPALQSPLNSAPSVVINPTMTWIPTLGAVVYRMQIATDPLFASVIFNDSTIGTTSRQVSGLSYSRAYYWRVRAKSSNGWGAFSSGWMFTTVVEPPAVPALVSPARSSTSEPGSLTLRWKSAARSSHYQVQLAIDSTFFAVIHSDTSVTDTFKQVGPLSGFSSYYWRVRAQNVGGVSAYSPVWGFTTTIVPPVLVLPAHGATHQPLSVQLMWSASHLASRYRVQVALDSSFLSTFIDDSSISGTTRIIGLQGYVTCYWRVSAQRDSTWSAFSAARNFSTVPTPPPPPTLSIPINEATNVMPPVSLLWDATPLTSRYHLQMSTDSPFLVNVIDDSTLSGTSSQVDSLEHNMRYFWRVRAINQLGAGAWSVIRSFTVISRPLATPILLGPATASRQASVFPTLTWRSTPEAQAYHLQLSSDVSFSTKDFEDATLTDTSQTVGPLKHNTRYYWRVKAWNSSWITNFSDSWSFTTPPVPGVYSLHQNFPNPFNPLTNIRYEVAEFGRITLRVHNMLGEVVATLVDDYKAPGVYEQPFEASHLASGVYCYVLTSAKFFSAQRMVLLK